ncbi:MAG: menaquinone biosynthesis protein [Planctomycetaceae bacterium]|nr:menaquinone biosynthesis protein [Planctomycetaceae bacterium]
MTLHIGTVPYCNAFPLIHYLPDYLPGAIITEWLPSTMRQQLAEGKLDLALMPVAELLALPQGKIISNCSIACNGAVRSVLLFSRKPIEQIRSIALDTASRSSVMICELLLRHFYGIQPEKHRLEGNQNPDDCRVDAFLIIGDRALACQPASSWTYRYDIGELWKAKTGLPLVFAAWVGCSPQVDEPAIALALEAARDRGVLHLEEILEAKEQQGIALPLSRAEILDYYRHAVVYTTGDAEQAGLRRFFELAE